MMRTSRELLRATMAVLASGLIACSGPSVPPDAMGDIAMDTASDVAGETAVDAQTADAIDAAVVSDGGTDAHADAVVDRGDVPPVSVTFRDGVMPTPSYNGTRDTYLAASAVGMNYGTGTTLWADGDIPAGMGAARVSLVRWDVSSIPRDSVVQSATMTFSLAAATNSASTDRYPIYAALRSWIEMEATWNDASSAASWATPGAGELGRDRGVTEVGGIPALASGSTTVRLNSTGIALVQQWITDPTTNFGVQISSLIANDGLGLSSRESTTAADRPALTVTYVPP